MYTDEIRLTYRCFSVFVHVQHLSLPVIVVAITLTVGPVNLLVRLTHLLYIVHGTSVQGPAHLRLIRAASPSKSSLAVASLLDQ